jgi:pimeloyl-ACP methyl ester carboxylesterase
VPKGAKSGVLSLEPCTYDTEDGALKADCGTVVVPENRNDPNSRLIALPVKRIRARSSTPAEPIFRLEGGPGISNMTFPQASRLTDDHDFVMVGYRGVEGSSVLDCPEVESALKRSPDFLDEGSFARVSDAYKDCAQRLEGEGVDLAGYSLPQRVDDMEAVRKALGYGRINLLSESAGTRTALIYAWRHPESIHRSVMIGVNPPGHYVWYPEATDELIRVYSALCAEDDGCAARTDDLAASMRRTAASMPDRWLFLPIKEGNVLAATQFMMFETTSKAAPLNAPTTVDSWLAAAGGDSSGFWLTSTLAGLFFPEAQVWGEAAATAMIDAEAANAYFAGGDKDSILLNAAAEFSWAGGLAAQSWPASPDYEGYRSMRVSDVETLLISGSLDFSTPARYARDELLPNLPRGKQVILEGFGHTADFWEFQRPAGTRLITSYLSTGDVDGSLFTPQEVDFEVGVASAPNIAKIVLATMSGLALLAVLLLGWMTVRVLVGGAFGPKNSIALRVLSPVVLGLGGWCLALLVVMVAWPSYFIGSQTLAVLPMGIAIGLGAYLAWVGEDGALAGFAVALGGAVAGAWLGYHAGEGLLSILTTPAGAAAGANFVLIVLDVARDRSGRTVTRERAAAQAVGMQGA